jgi:hypothetical protein
MKTQNFERVDEIMYEVSLFDLCEWFIEKYPEDVFAKKPEEIVIIREQMKKILEKGK